MICSTPRTGSTLLCQYLTSTGVAGIPHSYFRKEDMGYYAKAWNILQSDNSYRFADYMTTMQQANSTENGVFGIRVMWGSLEEPIANLKELYSNTVRDAVLEDLALLQQAFGTLKFIYLYRSDVISQAISLYRAEQTGHWHTVEGIVPKQHPNFNFKAIKLNVESLKNDNLQWQNWFQNFGIQPYVIDYDSLSSDPKGTTLKTLQFLDIDLPKNAQLDAPNKRLADELSLVWKERFIAELES